MEPGISRGRARLRPMRVAVALTAATAMIGWTPATAGAAAGDPSTLKVVQDLSGTTVTNTKPLTSRLAQTDPAVLKLTGTAPTSVMVKLNYDPLATYAGGIPGLAATTPAAGQKVSVASPAAVAYSGHINNVEQGFVAALHQAVPSAKVERTYHVVYGGLAVKAPANQIASLLSLPGVVAVQADSLHKLDSVAPVADDDAEFIGANSAYAALGSNATAGKGVIIADVDTGIWPEHPSFAARPDLPATPPPTPDGHTRACNFGTNPLTNTGFACNNKLIGGQVFLDTYNTLAKDELYPTSARDSNGHGTHTTSTAAGNPLVHAPLFGVGRGPVQGIAPGAFVMSYKALGPQGGFDSDLVSAIGQAIADGANVINYSVGPSSPQSPYTSPDDLAFLDAFDAGVFVSTSAGNSGPAAGSVAHNGPWETTVGASSLQRAFVSTATLTAPGGSTLTVKGSSIMPGITAATPVVLATSAAGYDAGCSTAAPAGSFTGKIVVCMRGGIGRIQKGVNVKAGGAGGMFLVNPVVEDTETDNHFLPAVHFDNPAGKQLIAFVTAHPTTTMATFTTGQEADGQGDVLAAFSSRGPAGPGGDYLKPDIVAPGVQILAGNTPTTRDIASGPPGQLFQSIAGTSFSAPQITGSAALVFALHPGWSPAQVKSALMTTANRKVVTQDGHTPAGVFDQGAGRVALQGVVDPGLTLDVTAKQMTAVVTDPIHRIDLNEPSVYDSSLPGKVTTKRVFKNVDTQTQVYDVSVTSDLKGAITVSPTRFTILPGKTGTVSITLDGTQGKAGTFYTGQIDLVQEQGSHHLHLPVAFKPISPAAGAVSLTSNCSVTVIHLSNSKDSTCTATAQNTALQPATVNLSTSWATNLIGPSFSPGGVKTGKTVKFPSTLLTAATPPDPKISTGSSPFGFVDLATFPSLKLQTMGDETITNFTTPAFQFAGQTYTSLGVVSNGYIVVGGGDANDISSMPQTFPKPDRPNNVLAPFWTDLDGGNGTIAGQGFYIGVLSSGANNWIAIQWNAHVFGAPTHLETFQVWLGMNGTEDISYAYDPAHPVTDPGVPLNIGAENSTGTAGSNFSGLPTSDLVVASTPGVPGGSVSYWVKLHPTGVLPGNAPSKVETDMTTSLTRDTSVSINNIQVLP